MIFQQFLSHFQSNLFIFLHIKCVKKQTPGSIFHFVQLVYKTMFQFPGCNLNPKKRAVTLQYEDNKTSFTSVMGSVQMDTA